MISTLDESPKTSSIVFGKKIKGRKEFLKQKHIAFFRRCLGILPCRMSAIDTSRMTIAFFAISGLDILNSLELVDNDRKEIIEWIYSLQICPNENKSNLANCGFRGSTFLKTKFDNDFNLYDTAHIAMTYTALSCLIILGDDLSRVYRSQITKSLRSLQCKDGSFCAVPYGSENDMRFIYCASCISYVLDDWSGVDIDQSVAYIKNSLSFDGGIGQGPGLESHGGSTYCALASLVLMNRLESTFNPKDIKRIIRWCLCRQQTGFQGRPNKMVDTCYSFWIGATLELLGVLHLSDYEANLSSVLQCQDPTMGGFSNQPEHIPDALHTYFALCGLSLLGCEDLRPIDAASDMSERALSYLQKLNDSS